MPASPPDPAATAAAPTATTPLTIPVTIASVSLPVARHEAKYTCTSVSGTNAMSRMRRGVAPASA